MAGSAGKAAGQSPSPSTYFRRTPRWLMVAIMVVNLYHAWMVFSPATIPYDRLGLLGVLTKYLANNYKTFVFVWFLIVWSIHIGEAFLALKLCRTKGVTDATTRLRWFVQTVLYGNASFFFLLIYRPPKTK